jgi:thiosulfate/3-mercaptopyruvate sulfurtransferase
MAIDRHPEALVSTAWLAAHLDDPDLRIFECTTYLRPVEPDAGVPYRPEAGRADYEAGHIPGAGFFDLPGELSRQDAAVHFMMLTAERFAEVMGRHGIGDGTRVVLYSRDRVMWATRVWWMLHVMGFAAAVLDGGFEKWAAEGRPVSAAPCTYPPANLHAPAAAGADAGQRGGAERDRRSDGPLGQHAEPRRLPWRGAQPLRPSRPHPAQRQSALAGAH